MEKKVHFNDYDDMMEAEVPIGYFIEQVYHQKRPHAALGCLIPVEFERKNRTYARRNNAHRIWASTPQNCATTNPTNFEKHAYSLRYLCL